jgi:hypothetical protein
MDPVLKKLGATEPTVGAGPRGRPFGEIGFAKHVAVAVLKRIISEKGRPRRAAPTVRAGAAQDHTMPKATDGA